MITQNYENLLAAMLASSSSKFGSLPVVSVDGLTKFLNNTFSNFPYSRITDLTTSKTAAGISVGTGSVRTIHVGEFVGATNTNPEQDIDIVISQFGDYNFCGSLFQFDFRQQFSANQKMNSTSSAVGGYGSMTMMIDTTLPAIVEALPTWLKTRLKTFDVMAHSDYTTVVTVPNNKLALRSYSELTGVSTGGFVGEGTQIQLYKPSETVRSKPKNRSSTMNVGYFTRSLSYNGTTPNGFMAGRLNNQIPNWQGDFANTSMGIAPFGCI